MNIPSIPEFPSDKYYRDCKRFKDNRGVWPKNTTQETKIQRLFDSKCVSGKAVDYISEANGKIIEFIKKIRVFLDCELESYLSDNYVNKIYIDEYIQLVDEIYEKYVPIIYLRRNYMKKNDMENYMKKEDMENYMKKEDMENYMAKDDMLQYMKKEDMLQYMKKKDMLQYMKKEDMERYVNQKIIHTIMFVSFIYLCWLYVYKSLYQNNNDLLLSYK